MVELVDLPAIPEGNVSDDDLLLIYDNTAGRSYKVTRSVFMAAFARRNGDAEFNLLSAETGTFTELVAAQITFVSAGGIADMVTAAATVAVPTIAAGASSSVNVPVPGAVAGMAVSVTFTGGLTAGLCFTAYVSAPDVVTVIFTNASSGSIPAASEDARFALFTLA